MPRNEASLSLPDVTRRAAGLRLSFGGMPAPEAAGDRAVPVETAVQIVYAPVPYAVMMMTPADFEDFAIGFSLTEGIVAKAADIRAIRAEAADEGFRIVVTLSPDNLARHLGRARAMTGRTGCGICGVEDFEHLPRAAERVRQGPALPPQAIARALAALEQSQPLNAQTRAVHAAAFADSAGALLVVREDVGRHNALDKMIGAAVRDGIDPSDGFVLVTSRCSFEMVEKAAIFGARAIIAISAPTSLAIERAERHGMGLMAVARSDGGTIFAGERHFDCKP